jgi:UDP-GlcNAc3NAcA epimerase
VAVENLKREGFEHFPARIIKNGDVMQDAALYYASKAEEKSDILQKIGVEKFVLATFHRQENTDHPEKLRNIVEGLNQIHRQMRVIVPLHPRTHKILNQLSIVPEFMIIEPVGYFDMIVLEKSCELIVTDSGGVQKEAYFFGKHCITLREQTEWTDLVENGFNILVGSDVEKLLQAFATFQNKKSDFSIDLYGNGHAAEKAANEIAAYRMF